ncbi:Imm10 family immunity protein [Glycomyces sp. MUSA5-2]|uniref:Imm10 family immunity protein n=1 Tax=Glycomyces sp. MUSA5-2 TaxID=2053002 RepID=UPI00300AF924
MEFSAAEVDFAVEDRVAQLFLAEADDEGHTVDIQSSLDAPDESDVRTGMDTYYISLDEEEAVYGGIRRCVMTRETITLTFSEQAAATFGTDQVEVRFSLPGEDISRLATHLRLLFTSGRSAEHPELDLSGDGE